LLFFFSLAYLLFLLTLIQRTGVCDNKAFVLSFTRLRVAYSYPPIVTMLENQLIRLKNIRRIFQ
jgi:hypothetical protein